MQDWALFELGVSESGLLGVAQVNSECSVMEVRKDFASIENL